MLNHVSQRRFATLANAAQALLAIDAVNNYAVGRGVRLRLELQRDTLSALVQMQTQLGAHYVSLDRPNEMFDEPAPAAAHQSTESST